MAAPLTTKPQVSGYKFLLRRLEHALLRRDPRMIHDPMRSQSRSLWVGVALAILVCLGAGILALIRPQGQVGDASIVLAKDSGAMYVRVGERLHPVLNLTSARLISGSAEKPKSVKDDKLGEFPRGPLLGIPGAPSTLAAGGGTPPWTVCETATEDGVETGVLAGDPNRDRTPQLRAGQALYVSAGDTDYLLYEGRRARVDSSATTVTRALGLDEANPRPISQGMLDTLPEVDPLEVPDISQAGDSGAVPGHKVGSVLKVAQATATEYYVVLADGVQQIPEAAASVLRAADTSAGAEIAEVAPAALADVPRRDALPVGDFPTHQPELVDAADAPISCVTWTRAEGDPEATLTISAGRELPLGEGVSQTPLAGADGPGERTDWFASPGATGWWVQSTDSAGPVRRAESLGYLSAGGVRFGVPVEGTAAVLGMEGAPSPMPWSIGRLLTPGPALSHDNAMVAHDSVIPDPEGRQVAVQGGD